MNFFEKYIKKKMNFLNLFGTKKDDNSKKVIETINLLAETLSTQEKRKNHLLKLAENMKKEAQEYVRLNKKENALASLKKKKMYEKEVSTIESMMFNLEMQKINLENSQIQKKTIDSLSQANSVMKNTMTSDKVESMMDELQDAVDQQQEISDALSRPLVNIDVDEDLRELEELNEIGKTENVIQLPDVPTKRIEKNVNKDMNKVEKDEVEEIKKQLELL